MATIHGAVTPVVDDVSNNIHDAEKNHDVAVDVAQAYEVIRYSLSLPVIHLPYEAN